MNPLDSRTRLSAFLAIAALLAVAPKAYAQNPAGAGRHDMAGMEMDMDLPPVNIPKGAIYTEADVRFMQGMIAHHAQAIYMANLAAAHEASPKLLKFTQKIAQSQTAEIMLMQNWLRAKNQFAPDTSSWHHMMMSGMLTPAQIDSLGAAKGVEFDRLFLRFMIQHHEGAITMVHDLFKTPLAGQDVDVSVFANDVETVQTAEIGTMYRMLNAL